MPAGNAELEDLRTRARELKAERKRLIDELATVICEYLNVIKRIRETVKGEPRTPFSNQAHFVVFETALVLVDPQRGFRKRVPAPLGMRMLRADNGLKIFNKYGRELNNPTE